MINQEYFSEKGLTSTSANYLANVGQECIAKYKAILGNLRWYSESLRLLSGQNDVPLKEASRVELSTLTDIIRRVGEINSFCAWIREAIKAKEALAEEFVDFETWKTDKMTLKKPTRPNRFTSDDIIAEFNIKQLNEFLSLEARAATIGKLIHPDGAISEARKQLHKVIEAPNTVDKLDGDVIITSYTPTMKVEDVDNWFMALQNEYRELERQLNGIKFDIKEEVSKRNRAEQLRYKSEVTAYSTEEDKLSAEYNAELEEYKNKVAHLKIRIPEKLVPIFNYLQSLGK